MTIGESKQALRKTMIQKRDNLNLDLKKAYDQWIAETLLEIIQNRGYQRVHTYLPMGSEIDLFPLITVLIDLGIQITCPKTLGNRKLEHLLLRSLEEIEIGKFGTQHPANAMVYDKYQDLIIVPGLAFDQHAYRLGYGGGYYDAFLQEQVHAQKIGIAYPFQIVNQVPKEAHDQQLNEVLFKPISF